MTAVRALVQKPRRKMHLAVLDGTAPTWLTYCDLTVDATLAAATEYDSAGGPTARLVHDLRALTARKPQDVCAYCRRYMLLIELLAADRYRGGREAE